MSQKSLSIAYAVRRQAKGLGPIPVQRAAPAVEASLEADGLDQVPDIIEETEDASAPQRQSALQRVMAKHRLIKPGASE